MFGTEGTQNFEDVTQSFLEAHVKEVLSNPDLGQNKPEVINGLMKLPNDQLINVCLVNEGNKVQQEDIQVVENLNEEVTTTLHENNSNPDTRVITSKGI